MKRVVFYANYCQYSIGRGVGTVGTKGINFDERGALGAIDSITHHPAWPMTTAQHQISRSSEIINVGRLNV